MFAILFATSIVIPHYTYAETPGTSIVMDAKTLGEKCTSSSSTLDLLCLQYVAGVNDTLSLMRDSGKLKEGEMAYCLPTGSGVRGLMLMAVKKYYADNPQEQPRGSGVMATLTVVLALRSSFPCQK
jgi:hypothetical protein